MQEFVLTLRKLRDDNRAMKVVEPKSLLRAVQEAVGNSLVLAHDIRVFRRRRQEFTVGK